MNIIKYKKVYLTISAILVTLAIFSVAFFGFNLSVDFAGGSIYGITYKEKIPELSEIKKVVNKTEIKNATVQKLGESSFVIKTSELNDLQKQKLKKALSFDERYKFIEDQNKNIGPTVSKELVKRSVWAIGLVVLIIILFIAFAFRKVSKPISSFKYGMVAIVALIHDIAIPVGIFAILGHFFLTYQIDVLFVTAVLAILGFSVNDTIVVFDRIRENLKNSKKEIKGKEFEEIVEKSLIQTLVRSVNTSFTTLVVLLFLFFVGGESTKSFALVLIVGVIAGTYSSIFIASPLLVYIEKYQKPKKEKKDTWKEDGIDPSVITVDSVEEN